LRKHTHMFCTAGSASSMRLRPCWRIGCSAQKQKGIAHIFQHLGLLIRFLDVKYDRHWSKQGRPVLSSPKLQHRAGWGWCGVAALCYFPDCEVERDDLSITGKRGRNAPVTSLCVVLGCASSGRMQAQVGPRLVILFFRRAVRPESGDPVVSAWRKSSGIEHRRMVVP
jgi:hypothetical protein